MDAVVIVIIVAVIVIVLIAAASYFFRRSRSGQRSEPVGQPVDPFATDGDMDAALRGNPAQISSGDLLEIMGHSWFVRGTLRLREGAFEWAEHLLDDADGEKRWLSIEEDPDLVAVLWTAAPSGDVQPGPRTLEWDGRRFTKEESGSAEFRSEATTGLDETGIVRYFDYTGDDDSLLSFEDYGETGKWEVAIGRQLSRYELRVFPAS